MGVKLMGLTRAAKAGVVERARTAASKSVRMERLRVGRDGTRGVGWTTPYPTGDFRETWERYTGMEDWQGNKTKLIRKKEGGGRRVSSEAFLLLGKREGP